MKLLCGLLVLAAGAVQLDGNSTEQVGPFSEGATTYTVPVADHEPSVDISSAPRQDEWAQAAERYALLRPSLEETAIVVHCQTTRRWAVTPEGWDEIPVHPDMRPEEILADIAYWHTDLRASWEQVEWWLCRVHASSRSSIQPVLDRTNYVLIRGEDFLSVDMRPHGLVELVFGEDSILFSTSFPRWVNLSILWSFLEPILPRTHFGVEVRGWYNGGEIRSRPIHCDNGFYMRIHFQSTPFLLSELFRSAPRHVACLHPVSDYPRRDDVRWSVVYIAGGHTLISSRVYERVDAHGQTALILGLHQRYPDLVDDNSYLVNVHWSLCSLEPGVNHAKERYVLAVIEEDFVEPTVVLKVDLPPVCGHRCCSSPTDAH